MSARPANKSAVLVAVCVILLTLAPLLYALSIGPALLLVRNNVISEKTWQRVYYPVLYAAYPSYPLKVWLELFA